MKKSEDRIVFLELVVVFQIAWEMVSMEIFYMCLGEYTHIEHISRTSYTGCNKQNNFFLWKFIFFVKDLV